jgi:site-specific recombinase XerD
MTASTISTQWTTALDEWVNWYRADGTRPQTIVLRRFQMARIARDMSCGPYDVTGPMLTGWLGAHAAGWQLETIRSHRSTIKSFYRFAIESGYVTTDPSAALRRVKAGTPKPRPASVAIVDAATVKAEQTPDDALMLELAAHHGMRRGEIAVAHTADVHAGPDGSPVLTVHGKGGKDRTIPLTGQAAAMLAERPAGWVFPGFEGTGRIGARVPTANGPALLIAARAGQSRAAFARRAGVTVDAVKRYELGEGSGLPVPATLAAIAAAAGLRLDQLETGRPVGHISAPWVGRRLKALMNGQATAHQLRHRFASTAYARTGQLVELSRMLGHANTETTLRYVQTGMDSMRAMQSAAR